MIKALNISKSYGNLQALSNVSLTLSKGEIVGLLGVNGAGKSTLMKIMSGIIEPDKGMLEVFGKTFCNNPIDLKRKIGYLSEENPLYGDMYVKEYLEYTAGIYNLDKTNVGVIIEKLNLLKESSKKISTLSRGNRQKVGIAQVLIHDPCLLILDEITSGLDPNQREVINNLILEFAKDRIILLSTHILSEVKEICSRFILMNMGQIIADKNMKDIDSIENTFFELINENNS